MFAHRHSSLFSVPNLSTYSEFYVSGVLARFESSPCGCPSSPSSTTTFSNRSFQLQPPCNTLPLPGNPSDRFILLVLTFLCRLYSRILPPDEHQESTMHTCYRPAEPFGRSSSRRARVHVDAASDHRARRQHHPPSHWITVR